MSNKILVVVLAVVVVVLGAALVYQNYIPKNQPTAENGQNQNMADETAGWKTYRQSGYGFEIKHPADMGVQQINDSTNMDYTLVFKTFYTGKENIVGMTMKFQSTDMLGAMGEAIDQGSFTEIDMAGVKGTKVVGTDNAGLPVNEVWVARNKQKLVYIFKGSGDIFEKMLSTFKFIDINVLSPTNGEKYVVGETYPIKWTVSDGIDKVDISISYGNKAEQSKMIAQNVDAKSGLYNWTIPKGLLDEIFAHTLNEYSGFMIYVSEKIESEKYYGVSGASGQFTITSSKASQ